MSKDQVGRHPFLMRRIYNNRADAIYNTLWERRRLHGCR